MKLPGDEQHHVDSGRSTAQKEASDKERLLCAPPVDILVASAGAEGLQLQATSTCSGIATVTHEHSLCARPPARYSKAPASHNVRTLPCSEEESFHINRLGTQNGQAARCFSK